MKILILENDQYMVESKDIPIIGRKYNLEDAVSGTAAQNKAFHALLNEYYISGMHSYGKIDLVQFKKLIKKNLGAGFESFIYVEIDYNTFGQKPQIKDAKTYLDIPLEIRQNPDMKDIIRGKLKSWADYTKKERMKTMDNLISEMKQVGINSAKFEEILDGMERKNDRTEKA